ncbi:glycerol-3-phosphate dehydrogenase, mitochondrial [Hyalella azteca]|uniref:Glycerol-3-phosphate dehydrogenase n=1 Tax=Hyalella azteca TaxID=294128 RepID=A0A979FKK2_HYAAZ|nr:glycerol-3-phosphate dehydrogenase, mitochondrial [Hyalella azteca]
MDSLQQEEFDVLVVGGGATGCGCALDAASRGLRTALVEREDFSSGTSSRSTKLIHGGVRYLQKAILGLDLEQYKMVKEALHERANLLDIAPHLSYPLPIMLPVYKWWQLPYFWAGIKMYDLVAGSKCVKSSYAISKAKALELFPMLKSDKLVGAIVYYDGQHNDARMNLSIALTATRLGAITTNYTSVVKLLKKSVVNPDGSTDEKICGARCRDETSGREFDVRAKCVINATGPFTDELRQMDDATLKTICAPSMGVHITLPDYYSPEQMGLLDPNTSDGRVIFFLPWEGRTIAGTTDTPCTVTPNPAPTEDDIQFILQEVKNYLSPDVEVNCGLEPLHTTSQTDGLLLEGAHTWTPTMYISVAWDFDTLIILRKKVSLESPLCCTVGRRLHSGFPYIDAEVRYACREYAVTAVDIIARRLRLAFLNAKRFNSLDTDKKGYISLNDLRRSLEVRGQDVPGEKLHEILKEIDLNLNGQVELEEYLQMMAALKSGSISHSRFAQLAQMAEEHATKSVISVERSGGGV